jgi:RNA polymerase sigma-70 factor (ECF subfamily)
MKNYNTYDDSELLKLLRKPKPICDNSFYVLYNRYSAKLNAFCLFKMRKAEDAEEIFQTTWVKFYQSISSGKDLDAVLPFLISIARNLIIDHYRANKTRLTHIAEDVDIGLLEEIAAPSALQSIESAELFGIVQAAVNCLDDIYKEAFILKRIDGLSLEEIADLCGVSLSCAKQRVSRATNMVKTIISPHVHDYIKVK